MMFRPQPPRDERELPDRFRFGDVEVELPTARVWRAEEGLHLEPKAFNLLLLLAANRGRIVEKEEIFERIWEGAYVGDNALTRVVSHLRHELGDDPEAPSVIETVRTRGYRFLPRVTDTEPQDDPGPSSRWAAPRVRGKVLMVVLALFAVTLVVWWMTHGSQTDVVDQVEWNPVQLTAETGYNADPSFSPDGSAIAYAAATADGLDIFVRTVEGGPGRQLTFDGLSINPAWSPRGDLVAYESRAQGGIWLVPAIGGEARRLTIFGNQPAFSPDGRQLVFAARAPHNEWWPAMFESTLWLVDLPRGDPRQLTYRNTTNGGHGMPSFSPDGEWVVFATGTYTGGQLWRVHVTGGSPKALVDLRPGDRYIHPVFSADGTLVYAVRRNKSFSSAIVSVPVEGSSAEPVVVASLTRDATDLTLSPAGERFAFSVVDRTSRIREVALTADAKLKGPPRTLAAPSALRVLRPRYSHEGDMLAFWHQREGVHPDLVVVDRAGTKLWTVLDLGGRESFGWMGGGRLQIPRPKGEDRDLLVDVRGRREIELSPLPDPALRFSHLEPRHFVTDPERRRILFTGLVGEARELFLWEVESAEPRRLTQFGNLVSWPEWSRDGRTITFQVATPPDDANQLWMLSINDGDLRQVQTTRGRAWGGRTSPDGERVVYVTSDKGPWHLAVAGPDHPEQKLVAFEGFGYVRWPDWSPDGDRIAYEETSAEAQVYTMAMPSLKR